MVSQYERSTGTRFVISGSIQLKCATINMMPARIAVTDKVIGDFLLNKIPANSPVQAI